MNGIGVELRQLLGLTADGVHVRDDGSVVVLALPAAPAAPAAPASRTCPALVAGSVRLAAGGIILDCPVEAVRALIADAVDGQLFTTGRLYMAHVDAYDPYDPAKTTALRLAARTGRCVTGSFSLTGSRWRTALHATDAIHHERQIPFTERRPRRG